MTTEQQRQRQRQRWGNVCMECRRQKQKCDRQSPCGNCVRRRIPHRCERQMRTDSVPAPVAMQLRVPALLSTVAGRADGADGPGSPQSAMAGGRPRVGHIWHARDAPSYHDESFFGHQAAAAGLMDQLAAGADAEAMAGGGPSGVHLTSSAYRRSASTSHHGALSLHAHIWELLGHVPHPRGVVDALVQQFFEQLNEAFDGLHQATFMRAYEAFWNRRWGDDDRLTVDLRWLSLLFMVLAFSELLLWPADASPQASLEHEETSLQFFWASRKCVVIAPTMSGESADLVRAGLLITRYLIFSGRKAEAWLTNSFAVRMAQAQGMHVDGANWGLPAEVCETRRRLWAALYTLDRTLALAVGRPYVIHDMHWDAAPRETAALSTGFYLPLQQRLSSLLGRIQDECFGLAPSASSHSTTDYHAYETVLRLDGDLLAWADTLPPVFRLHDPDVSLDTAHPHLFWHRRYLHAQFHFARITLHRTYVVVRRRAVSAVDRFRFSRDACLSSACADLQLKLAFPDHRTTMADRLKGSMGAHNLFNSTLVLGLIAVCEPLAPETPGILVDLQAYCDKLTSDTWSNDFVLAEVRVIELCIARAKKARLDAATAASAAATTVEATTSPTDTVSVLLPPPPPNPPLDQDSPSWLNSWLGPSGSFPEPADFHLWADLVGNLERQDGVQ